MRFKIYLDNKSLNGVIILFIPANVTKWSCFIQEIDRIENRIIQAHETQSSCCHLLFTLACSDYLMYLRLSLPAVPAQTSCCGRRRLFGCSSSYLETTCTFGSSCRTIWRASGRFRAPLSSRRLSLSLRFQTCGVRKPN